MATRSAPPKPIDLTPPARLDPAEGFAVEIMNIDDLKPASYNPRGVEVAAAAALGRSLDRFGLVEPLVYNKRSGQLVGGHQRLELLKARGATRVPVRVVDLDEREEKALNLVLNNTAAQGFFTDEVKDLLDDLRRWRPDLYDEMLLFKVSEEAQELAETAADQEAEAQKARGVYDLSPTPYESWDYVVVIFKNAVDWSAAVDHFQIKRVADVFTGKRTTKAIGLGHVIDGGEYLARIFTLLGRTPGLTPAELVPPTTGSAVAPSPFSNPTTA